ncbi:hypothetical protein AGOR_G00214610 [Albula goreensis]|uniref:Uncharacterized protein n=1 Tax=Albula goreensis TaxID=1534307 RepID=A0A8T3CLV2_9TELE|nr:hypothetical protein AGOR_G00214610 [Albula goreensis]
MRVQLQTQLEERDQSRCFIRQPIQLSRPKTCDDASLPSANQDPTSSSAAKPASRCLAQHQLLIGPLTRGRQLIRRRREVMAQVYDRQKIEGIHDVLT